MTAHCFFAGRPFGKHGSDLVAAERFGQHLPLLRQVDVQGRILIDLPIEQQMPIKMPDGRKLSSDGAAVELVGK